jgi:hypothetical protein
MNIFSPASRSLLWNCAHSRPMYAVHTLSIEGEGVIVFDTYGRCMALAIEDTGCFLLNACHRICDPNKERPSMVNRHRWGIIGDRLNRHPALSPYYHCYDMGLALSIAKRL